MSLFEDRWPIFVHGSNTCLHNQLLQKTRMGTTISAIIICMLIAFVHARNVVPPQARNKGVFKPTFPKQEVARNIQRWSPLDIENIWERSGLFEGDIMQEREEGLKNILQDENLRWSNATIPYHIIDEDFSEDEMEIIQKAIEEYHNRTCIKFRPYQEGDEDYVRIESGQPGCWSFVGRRGGGQVVNLQRPACVRHGVVIHELLHAVGFFHQQSAHDRDDYVRINWKNILPGREYNFEKYNSSIVTSFDVPYDYGSIMHYSAHAFTKNGKPTITPLQQNVTLGQRKGLSNRDIKKLQRLYGCAETQQLEVEVDEVEEEEIGEEEYSLWKLVNALF